ncbi:MAG: hypothetical protein KC505_05800 [Myxococcales bacterium]|nr:hypothetical protein [Myxococcales bacterium]USN49823.1 MAG: hypothetical protein H6731_05970 [Myxococcales bacterium]
MLRFFFASFLITCSFACTKKNNHTQSSQTSFEHNYSIEHNIKEDTLLVTVKLNKGFHAYGPGEKIGKAVDLRIASDNGWSALGSPEIPKPQSKNLKEFGTAQIFENQFVVKQKLKHGIGIGKALLSLQICTNESCDRPKVHELLLE